MKVGVHQGSVLSSLLFIIVLEALSREFREGLSMELLYADDLVLMAESKELLVEKIRRWKAGMEEKGLKVNMGKTKAEDMQQLERTERMMVRWMCGQVSIGEYRVMI